MVDADRKPFAALIADVQALYRRDTSAFVLDVWWEACRPFELEQVRKAFSAHATDPQHGRFPPLPADLVRVLQGTYVDRSLLAWGKVMNAASAVGAYGSVAFDDPAIHAAIEDLGGWPKLVRTEGKDLSILHHRFCEAHRAYTARGGFPYPSHLPGLHEGSNALRNLGRGPQVALIGDAERAAEVLRLGGSGSKTPITDASLPVRAGAQLLRLKKKP